MKDFVGKCTVAVKHVLANAAYNHYIDSSPVILVLEYLSLYTHISALKQLGDYLLSWILERLICGSLGTTNNIEVLGS